MSTTTTGDVRHAVDVLRRFDRHAALSLATIGGLSFLGGVAEAGVLAMVTSVAVATTGDGSAQDLLGLDLSVGVRLWAALGLLAVNAVIGVLLAHVSSTVAARSSENARRQLLQAFHHASYERKAGERLGTLQEALTTYVDRFTSGFLALLGVVSALLSLVSFAVAAVVINVTASLALLVVGALVIGVQRPANRRTKGASAALTSQRAVYTQGATESVLLARELAVFGVSGRASDRLLEMDHEVAAQFRRTKFLAGVTPRVYQTTAFLLAIGGLALVSRSEVRDLAGVAAVALILLRSLSYGQALLTTTQQVAEYRPYLDNLVERLESYRSRPRERGTEAVGPLQEICLQGVGFSYAGGPPVVDGLDLTIHAGETIGVVGPSGAGKTTLVNLVLRLYEPTEGQILVNGVPLGRVEDDEWHRRTAIVPQEPRLLHGTVADNIRFLRDLDDEAIEQAARQAHVADFVGLLPQGYDAPVGELGQGLSGGERQRVCIARALAGRPDLLVLDEPTSALDGGAEATVQRTLQGLKGSVTMVIVAHRLSTLAICDRIVVVDGGRVAAVGTPEDLRRDSAYYRDALEHAGL
ncbi:MAG TPA: ABC transporter ATP-binding protein [Aquihabitans sp.]|jgi:ABC-type multidrug transport system fused ATPase/permease subunit|nr:ABC transporter ATP-binding protein [Aquihabitans sp.]